MKLFQLGVAIFCAVMFSGVLIAAEHGGGMMEKGKGCHYCGMNLEKFAHSAMDISYDDGSMMQVCSIHCAAIDLANNIDKTPVKIEVGDFNTKEKIDAETAYWVIDDKNPGVMTSRAKWAFSDESKAKAFMTESGGSLVTFEDAMLASYTDMYNDTKMIRNKRKMMKQGKKMGGH